MLVATSLIPQGCDNQNISRHYQMSPTGRAKGHKITPPREAPLEKILAVLQKTTSTYAEGILSLHCNFISTSASLVLQATKISSSLASPGMLQVFLHPQLLGQPEMFIHFCPQNLRSLS